jgi:hypothetical protein
MAWSTPPDWRVARRAHGGGRHRTGGWRGAPGRMRRRLPWSGAVRGGVCSVPAAELSSSGVAARRNRARRQWRCGEQQLHRTGPTRRCGWSGHGAPPLWVGGGWDDAPALRLWRVVAEAQQPLPRPGRPTGCAAARDEEGLGHSGISTELRGRLPRGRPSTSIGAAEDGARRPSACRWSAPDWND